MTDGQKVDAHVFRCVVKGNDRNLNLGVIGADYDMNDVTTKMNGYYYRLEDGCDNRFICQYMRLDYLIQLLETETYYVKRRKNFIDANESFESSIEGLGFRNRDDITLQLSSEEVDIRYKDIIDCPTSCWSMTNQESFLMWKSYATEMGACIKTTTHDFIASIKSDLDISNKDNKLLCGSMDYVDYSKQVKNMDNLLFGKDLVYADENEYRFYFLFASDRKECGIENRGIHVPVNTKVLIGEVLLSPFICKDAANKIARMLKCSYNIEVKLSKIELRL